VTKAALRMLRLMDRAVSAWHIPVIGKEKGRVLRRLLARYEPRRGVEVGTLFGYSAILVGGSLPRGGRLTCVEQNAYLALQVAHRGYVLETGRIVMTDAADRLAQNPQVRAAYLGG